MPILTCPFASIAAQRVALAEIRYPKRLLLSMELTIKPTATESWSIEGLSLQFTTAYAAAYSINIGAAKKSLEKSIVFLKESRKLLEQILVLRETQQAQLQNIYTKVSEKGEPIATEEAAANNEAAKAEVRSVKREIESTSHEIEVAEKELKELGRQAAREGAKAPPLLLAARMYARTNELIWSSDLAPSREGQPLGFTLSGEGFSTTSLTTQWNEALNTHIQFDDPIDITERENLRLVIEIGAPKASETIEGGQEGPTISSEPVLSAIQAIVNYSRQVAG